jgi:hypothetical protein
MQAGDQDTFFLGTKAYVHAGNSFSPEISFETLWTLHIVEQVGSSMAALKLLRRDKKLSKVRSKGKTKVTLDMMSSCTAR